MTDAVAEPLSWATRIRDVPDFPKPGILFKDITPLLADGPDFASALDALAQPWRGTPLDAVLGIEARGFILGAPLAHELRVGFVPVRKPGKLPAQTLAQDYGLEYGRDRIEIHADALQPGMRVLLVDDVLATRRHPAGGAGAGAAGGRRGGRGNGAGGIGRAGRAGALAGGHSAHRAAALLRPEAARGRGRQRSHPRRQPAQCG
ncbi:adenine phosphoribosyltransferase [Xanthomonas sacchari]|nr:adenine phosphoribosyltransferase [Xanthomonas sacchari]